MPTRNSRKEYMPNSFYHLYSRGSNKEPLFLEDSDYKFFLSLLKRYLSSKKEFSKARVLYPNFRDKISICAYALMKNHIHLLVYQTEDDGIKKLMQSVMTSYGMYFNQKYKHYGPVFQSRYLASLIDNDSYLQHISRYIHLNPKNYADYPYTSLQNYLKSKESEWLDPSPIMDLFSSGSDYIQFLEDYEDHKAMLEEIKYELADC